MSYHFDDKSTPLQTLLSGKKNTRTCPFSGRYALTGSHSALTGLLNVGDEGECHTVSYFMQAGCSESSDLHVESTCHPRPVRDPETRRMVQNDAPINVRNEFTCHGQWATLDGAAEGGGGAAAMTTRQLLLLSSPRSGDGKGGGDSASRRFMCLEFSKVTTPGVNSLYDFYSFQIIPPMGKVSLLLFLLILETWTQHKTNQ